MKEIVKYSFALLLIFTLMEVVSIIILTVIGIDPFQGSNYSAYKASGYYCFANNPNYEFYSYDSNEENKFTVSSTSLKTDDFGFISSSELSIEKPENTIRIFVRGGSAMFGSLQTDFVKVEPLYPRGNFSFNSSIAGLLEKKLQVVFPNKKIEVINAAVVQHSFYQNLSMYNSLLHLFKPDVIVSMDGFNDNGSVERADFYQLNEEISGNFIKMEAEMQSKHFPFTLFLMNYWVSKISKRRTTKLLNNKTSSDKFIKHQSEKKTYELNKERYLKNSEDLFWMLETYSTTLLKNDVYPIVCLQPFLKRKDTQKQLTVHEKKLFDFLDGSSSVDLIEKYFWGLDFSPIADSILKKNNGKFIDLGKVITEEMNGNQEAYLDYCHLTYKANEVIAERLKDSIKEYLILKNKS